MARPHVTINGQPHRAAAAALPTVNLTVNVTPTPPAGDHPATPSSAQTRADDALYALLFPEEKTHG